MSDPYFDKSELATRYYNLFGRIVTAWSRIERTVDVALYSAGAFHGNTGEAIASWKKKLEALSDIVRDKEYYQEHKNFLEGLLTKLGELGTRRNKLVHSYLSKSPDTEGGRFILTSVRFHKVRKDRGNIEITIKELLELLNDLYRLDANVSIFIFFDASRKSQKLNQEFVRHKDVFFFLIRVSISDQQFHRFIPSFAAQSVRPARDPSVERSLLSCRHLGSLFSSI